MENFISSKIPQFEEISLSIYDSETVHYGGNQYWFPKRFHKLSGCGPVAAANITAYLAKSMPDRFYNLYPHKGDINKKDFISHLINIRKYVRPGVMGLTSVHKFRDNVISFAKSKGVSLYSHILYKNANMEEAINFMSEALSQKLPLAILILKHPVKELDEYTWHWMTITNLNISTKDNKYYISVSTYGELRYIDLDLLWNNRRPKDIIRLIYFT